MKSIKSIKITAALIAVFMLITMTALMTACNDSSKEQGNKDNKDSNTFKIVSTTFPQYDWVREIIGDRAEDFELTLLADSSVDLHSYEPSIGDIVKISSCDMFSLIILSFINPIVRRWKRGGNRNCQS